MNRLLTLLSVSAVLAFSSCVKKSDHKVSSDLVNIEQTANGKAPSGKSPAMTFDTEKHDFGTITEGQQVKCAFHFKNTGGSDLIISDAHGSCGCTVPEYPHKPIAPGEDGVIDVVFNSTGKSGQQTKTVTLVTNCENNSKILTITSNVVAKENK